MYKLEIRGDLLMKRMKALEFPKSVLIETCSLCNGECKFCPYKKYRGDNSIEILPMDIIKNLLDELKVHKIERLTLFANNEPLVDSRIVNIIRKSREILRNVEITLSTNGRLLTKDLAINLYKAGLSVLYVSIPTLDLKIYKELMGYDLDFVLNNIRDILSTDAKNMIRIAVPQTYGFSDKDFRVFNEQYGVKYSSWPIEYKKSWGIFDFEEMSGGNNLCSRVKACDRPLDQAVILADGSMVLCCRDWNREAIIGNVKESSIEQLWKSSKMMEYQKKIIENNYKEIKLCSDCSEAL